MIFNTEKLGKFASEIVYEAGQLLLELKNAPLELEEKKNHSDLVTIVDQKIEQFLVDKIMKEYPSHGVMGEEGTFKKDISTCETVWIIDPIDGTTNFIHDFPFYGISVGIAHKGEGVIGVVYNPSTDELYYGEKDKGAFVNHQPLKIKKSMKLKEALVSTTMYWANPITEDALHSNIITLYKNTRGMRMIGGAAISICEIATGKINAYIMPMLHAWDFAGGVIIAKEAGALVSRLDNTPFKIDKHGGILVSHPDIHEQILNMPNWYPVDKK